MLTADSISAEVLNRLGFQRVASNDKSYHSQQSWVRMTQAPWGKGTSVVTTEVRLRHSGDHLLMKTTKAPNYTMDHHMSAVSREGLSAIMEASEGMLWEKPVRRARTSPLVPTDDLTTDDITPEGLAALGFEREPSNGQCPTWTRTTTLASMPGAIASKVWSTYPADSIVVTEIIQFPKAWHIIQTLDHGRCLSRSTEDATDDWGVQCIQEAARATSAPHTPDAPEAHYPTPRG